MSCSSRLAPIPLNGDGPEKMIAKVRKSRKSIGELLMDQTMFEPESETSFAPSCSISARLSPFRPGKRRRGRRATVDMEGCRRC